MFVAITLFFNTYLLLLFILAVSGRSCVTRDRPLWQSSPVMEGGVGS